MNVFLKSLYKGIYNCHSNKLKSIENINEKLQMNMMV